MSLIFYARIRWLLVFTVVLAFVGTGIYLNGHRYHLRSVFPREVNPRRFAKQIDAFRKWDREHKTPPNVVLFIGSSSIGGWDTDRFFPTLPVLNRGFGGSHISDINHFLKQVVFPHRPKVVVFYAGDNDISGGKKPARVLRDYQQFVKRIHEKLPDTQIVFLPIKPSIRRWGRWPAMKKANAMIKSYSAQDSRLHYVDTASPMLNDTGLPHCDLFVKDGLHLNQKGYEMWTELLTPYIENILKLS